MQTECNVYSLCAVVSFDNITNCLLQGYASFKISPASLTLSLQRKYKDYDLQKYNFTIRFVWVLNLVTNSKEGRRMGLFMN